MIERHRAFTISFVFDPKLFHLKQNEAWSACVKLINKGVNS